MKETLVILTILNIVLMILLFFYSILIFIKIKKDKDIVAQVMIALFIWIASYLCLVAITVICVNYTTLLNS